MVEDNANPAPAGARLQRVGRLLTDLRVTEEYLRQYPALAEKVAALMDQARSSAPRG